MYILQHHDTINNLIGRAVAAINTELGIETAKKHPELVVQTVHTMVMMELVLAIRGDTSTHWTELFGHELALALKNVFEESVFHHAKNK